MIIPEKPWDEELSGVIGGLKINPLLKAACFLLNDELDRWDQGYGGGRYREGRQPGRRILPGLSERQRGKGGVHVYRRGWGR